MTRLQINDQFDGGRLQTQARPVATPAAVQQLPDGGSWQGLANAFAGAEMLAEKSRVAKAEADTTRAQAYANSMTVSELGKRISAGDMLASESPVFAATLQNTWGQNSQDALTRDTLSKISTGHLKFSNPEEIDAYLTEARNTTLAGHGKYATAGFDRGYNALRGKMMDSTAQVNDKATVEQAANQASDRLGNKLLEVTGVEFKGTPQDAANALLGEYQLLRQTKVMPDGAAKGALQEVLTRAAAGGKPGVLDALLNSELPDIGTVRAFLGETRAQTLTAQATSQFDAGQRQRIDEEVLPHMLASDTGALNVPKFMEWAQSEGNKKFTSASTIHSILNRNMQALAHQQRDLEKANMRGASEASIADAKRRTDAQLINGTLWQAQGSNNPQVLTDTGKVVDFNVKEYAEQSLKQKTQGLPMEAQVMAWAQNGLTNPDWKLQGQAGFLNLASIGVDSQGKPTGTLNKAGEDALALFKQVDAVNPESAKDTFGDTAYKRFSDIAFLTRMGRTASDAAGIASNTASGAIEGSDTAKLVAKVHSKVNDIVTGAWYKPDFLMRMLGDNTTANTTQVTGQLRRYATLLAHSGQYGDAEAAVAAAAGFMKDPQVSTRINGTLYLRSELPTPPKGETTEDYFAKFLDAVPKARAKELGMSGDEVRLEYNPAMKAYQAMALGVPLTKPDGFPMVISKADIQAWYGSQRQIDILKAVTTRPTKPGEYSSVLPIEKRKGRPASVGKTDW